jgi:tryptophan-rich sensory protein
MFLLFSALTALASLAGANVSRRAPKKLWYRALRKPRQTPPDWVFGVVWPVLYGLIAWSGSRAAKKKDRASLALWSSQLVFNAAWSPLFFGAQKSRLALVDLGLTLATASAYTWRVAKTDRPAAIAMTPYLAWLTYAGTLNAEIVRKNPALLAG